MKKGLSLILAAAAVAVMFSSCAAKPVSSSTSAAATVLKVGVDASYPPMEYTDNKGNIVGFDIDVANAIGKKMGVKVQFLNTAWDGIFQGLKANKYDCIISSVSIKPDREKSFLFTKPYINNAQMIIVKPGDNSINKPEDLANKKVGVQVDTTANDSATKLNDKGVKFTLRTYPQVIQPFLDLKAGNVQAVVVDEVVGNYYIKQDSSSYKAAAAKLTNEPIGICMKQGDTALQSKLQTALDALFADGTMKDLSVKWFGTDLTSNIDTTYKDIQ